MTPIRLESVEPFVSLPPLGKVEIPPLCVLTGPNGSGKTQLLQAIARNHVKAWRAEEQLTHNVYLGPRGWRASGREPLAWERVRDPTGSEAMRVVRAVLSHLRESKETACAESVGAEGEIANALEELQRPHSHPRAGQVSTLKWKVHGVGNGSVGYGAENLVDDQRLNRDILTVAAATGKHPTELNDEDFRDWAPPLFGQSAVPADISLLCMRYKHLQEQNDYHSFLRQERNRECVSLGDADFKLHYGEPPWNRINEILERLGVRALRIAEPVAPEQGRPSSLQLEREGGNWSDSSVHWDPWELSGGENLLFAMAVALVSEATPPKMLLLDEVDACLHPAAAKRFMQNLRDTFVKELKVSIVLASHSATTVALAQEDEVFLLDRNEGRPLRRVGRDAALRSLLGEAPSIRVLCRDHRTVLVEGDDGPVYEAVWTAVQQESVRRGGEPRLVPSNVSLSFLHPAGGTGGNASKDVVMRLVNSFGEDAGVFGIIDRDDRKPTPTSNPDSRVLINGGGERYTIENFILDPVIIGVFLRHYAGPYKCPEQLASHTAFNFSPADIPNLDNVRLQNIADVILERVADAKYDDALAKQSSDEPDGPRKSKAQRTQEQKQKQAERLNEMIRDRTVGRSEARRPTEYLCGGRVSLPSWFMDAPGHALQDRYARAFPELNTCLKGGLPADIAKTVFDKHPGLCPMAMVTTLQDLTRRQLPSTHGRAGEGGQGDRSRDGQRGDQA